MDLEDSLYDAFHALIPDMKIIYANQAYPEPIGLYLNIKPIHMNQKGNTETGTLAYTTDNTTYSIKIKESYEWYVQIAAIGEGADTQMLQILTLLNSPQGQYEFQSRGFSLLRKTQLRRVPLKREDKWVECQNVELYFLVELDTDAPTPIIDYIGIVNTEFPEDKNWIPSKPPQ